MNAKPGLTQPRSRSTWGVTMVVIGLSLFGVVILLVYVWGKQPLTPIPAASTVHAAAMLVVCSTTAALLLTHARATRERGYLVLGGTFLYVAGIMLLFPTVYPNGVLPTDPPTVMWGTLQSSATLFHPWHLAVIVGVTASAFVLGHDQRTGRRPTLGHGMLVTVVVVVVALALTVVVVVPLIDVFPPVVEGVQATPAALVGFRVEALLALIGAVVVAYESRNGSLIGRWLLAVMVVTLGEAITMLNADRYSLAWYYNRVIGLVAALILLFVLVRDLGRVERTTRLLMDRDSLTGAASRAAVLAELDREVLRERRGVWPACLVWIDIDGFKEINERVGQQVGDRILAECFARIRDVAPPVDVVGRMGGDEFAIILTDAHADTADALAQRVIERMREPFHVMDSVVMLTVSVGLAVGAEDGPRADKVRADSLARRASIAMLAAKNAGGDRLQWFAESLGSDALRRASLRHSLTEAIHDHRFSMEYQPIIDMVTGEVVGAEALVGWDRDGRRESAGTFIAFAEDSGLIVSIGRQVVAELEREVLELLLMMPAPFFVTLNQSVKELSDEGIVEALLQGPLSGQAERLVVEVTESFEMHAESRAAANLERIRARGYRVAIDDFGAGFSNFVRLSELRPAFIKVDRSIVVRAGTGSPEGVATLRATTDVARALQCQVLAEGIESNDEAAVCTQMGIDLAQGYRYSRSLPPDALVAFQATRAIDAIRSVADLGEFPRSDGHARRP